MKLAAGEKLTETSIARLLALYTFARRCVLLVPNCSWTGAECDVLGITTDLRVIDCEIKISRSDLKADIKKDKWWRRDWSHGYRKTERKEWPDKVWKHYYVMPAEVWRDELVMDIPAVSGVIVLADQGGGDIIPVVKRRARPQRDAFRLKPEHVIDVARLANLRQWEATERLRLALASTPN